MSKYRMLLVAVCIALSVILSCSRDTLIDPDNKTTENQAELEIQIDVDLDAYHNNIHIIYLNEYDHIVLIHNSCSLSQLESCLSPVQITRLKEDHWLRITNFESVSNILVKMNNDFLNSNLIVVSFIELHELYDTPWSCIKECSKYDDPIELATCIKNCEGKDPYKE